MQNDLNNLFDWSNTWQMEFNIDKCCVIHLGYQNLLSSYKKLDDKEIKAVDFQEDVGVIVDNKMKFSQHFN